MKKIVLNLSQMNTDQALSHLKESFGIKNDSVLDLDLLYSEVMSIKEETSISIDDSDLMVENLGRFGLGLIKLFRDAEKESDYITFEW